jgi:UDP-glucose 4-epimerase
MTKCLVVGGTGYVGRELCRQLADRGQKVFVFGRSEPPDTLPGVWLKGDITQEETLRAILGDERFDVIYHVASLPGDTGNPVEMVAVNLLGLTHVLNYARDTKVERFVLSSSISAYEWYPATEFNPPEYLPVDEEHPTRPKDMYASTKRAQEILAMTFYHQFGLPVTVLRLTAVVGPGGRGGGRSWREFAQQLGEGKRIQVPHFSAEELCHYVDLRDVARMHITVAEHPAAVGEIFNCCGPKPTSGAEFSAIVKYFAPGIKVEYGFPWSMAQGGKIAFDMSKAKTTIGFAPRYTMDDSIQSIKDWINADGLAEEDSDDEACGTVVGEAE